MHSAPEHPDMEFDQLVGSRLHACRREAGLAVIETCARTGMARQDLADIEAGLVRMRASELFTLADVLGCQPADFFPDDRAWQFDA